MTMGLPDLPERVPVLSFWGNWARAVAAGIKTIDSRTWAWTLGPTWVAVHASKQFDGDIPGRIEPFPSSPYVPEGALCALVWISESRPLVPEDKPKALVYRPGLFAFELHHLFRLAPVQMKGPRKIGYVDRLVVARALVAGNPPHFQDTDRE